MDTSLVLALVAVGTALIGVFGTGIAEILKSKKQSEEIRKDIGNVQEDTKDMRPRAKNIEVDTKKIRDEVVEKLVPSIQTISVMASKVEDVHKEVEYKNRIKSELSTDLKNKDYFVEGIEKLYEKNGQLESENRELRYQLNQAQEQNQRLSDKLSEVNRELKKQLNDQNCDNHQANQGPVLF